MLCDERQANASYSLTFYVFLKAILSLGRILEPSCHQLVEIALSSDKNLLFRRDI